MGYKFRKTTSTTEIVELHVEKCIACGGTDVYPWDCGYSSFNVCGVKCNCGRDIKFNSDYTIEQLIEKWNHWNGSMTDERRIALLREQLRALDKEPLV